MQQNSTVRQVAMNALLVNNPRMGKSKLKQLCAASTKDIVQQLADIVNAKNKTNERNTNARG